jgi:hypothetical protein
MIATTELHATAEMKLSLGAGRRCSAPGVSIARKRLATLSFPLNASRRSSAFGSFSVCVLSLVIFVLFFSPAARAASRWITRADVLRAIRVSLQNNPRLDSSSIDFSTLEMSAQIAVPSADPQLEVTAVNYDRALRRVRFRLWPRAVPSVVPFFATARLTDSGAPPRVAAQRPVVARSVNPQSAGPVFIQAGRPAHLHLHSRDSEILLLVKPLQRGHLGDTVRVHIPATGATLQARVVAPGYLDASF